MRLRNSTAIGLVLAAGVGALVAGWPVLAQQTPAANEPPPPWAQGRPSADIQLAPVVPPPLATAADKLPVEVGRPNLEFDRLDLDEKTLALLREMVKRLTVTVSLRRGRGLPAGKKVLLVLDQFEILRLRPHGSSCEPAHQQRHRR